MPSRTVRYWHRIDEYVYRPLATRISELNFWMKTGELEWCPECIAAVEPEGRLEAAGLYNVCPFCGTRTQERR